MATGPGPSSDSNKKLLASVSRRSSSYEQAPARNVPAAKPLYVAANLWWPGSRGSSVRHGASQRQLTHGSCYDEQRNSAKCALQVAALHRSNRLRFAEHCDLPNLPTPRPATLSSPQFVLSKAMFVGCAMAQGLVLCRDRLIECAKDRVRNLIPHEIRALRIKVHMI